MTKYRQKYHREKFNNKTKFNNILYNLDNDNNNNNINPDPIIINNKSDKDIEEDLMIELIEEMSNIKKNSIEEWCRHKKNIINNLSRDNRNIFLGILEKTHYPEKE